MNECVNVWMRSIDDTSAIRALLVSIEEWETLIWTTTTPNQVKRNMNDRNGWKMLSKTYKCGSYLVVFMSLSLSLASAFLPSELNEIDVPFTALDSAHSNRKGRCKCLSSDMVKLSLCFFFCCCCVLKSEKLF